MASVGHRIRQAREAAGLSQEELAARVGCSRAAVGTWERDEKEPRRSAVKRLSVALNQPESYFDRIGSGGIAVAPDANSVQIIQIDWSDIARLARGDEAVNATTVSVEVTPVNQIQADEHRIVVIDDSMAPTIRPDDVIAFSTSRKPADGDLVIAYVDGHDAGVLRNYRERGNGHFDIWPANPIYPTVTHNSQTPVTIVGVAIRHLRNL